MKLFKALTTFGLILLSVSCWAQVQISTGVKVGATGNAYPGVGSDGSGGLTVTGGITTAGQVTVATSCTSGTVGAYCPPASAVLPANVIDARFVVGVDCTGATDSSAALNALTTVNYALNNKKLSFLGCGKIHLEAQWLIQGQDSLEIDFGPRISNAGDGGTQGGTQVYGCNGPADFLIRVNGTNKLSMHGGALFPKYNACATGSNFTGALEFTNASGSPYSQSAFTISDMQIAPGPGQGITNFIGVYVNGGPNQEFLHFSNVDIHCNQSAHSYGFWQNSLTSDSTTIDYSSISDCYTDVKNDSGQMVNIFRSDLNGAAYSIMGAGASLTTGVMHLDDIVAGDGSGTLNAGDATGRGGGTFLNVVAYLDDIDPNLYMINPSHGDFTTLQYCRFQFDHMSTHPKGNMIVGMDPSQQDPTSGAIMTVNDMGGNVLGSGILLSGQALNYGYQRNPSFWMSNFNQYGIPGNSGGWAALPPAKGGTSMSSYLGVVGPWSVSGNDQLFDMYFWRSYNIGGGYATLVKGYNSPAGATITPYTADQTINTGLTAASIAAAGSMGGGPQGTVGSTTYTYVGVPLASCGHGTPFTFTIPNGNASLSGTNYNLLISFPTGAWGVAIYRTVGGATQGYIGTTTMVQSYSGNTFPFTDTGYAGDGTTPPTGNTSGCVIGTLYQETLHTPATSSEACNAGQFTDDANYHYVCTATNTWKRTALSTF
jgi:hypothetical protein